MTNKVCNRAQNGTNACQTSDSLFLDEGEQDFFPYHKTPDATLQTHPLYQY